MIYSLLTALCFLCQESPYFPTGEVNVSLCFDQMTRRLKVQVVKARNLCCRASEGKKIDRCGVSWFGESNVVETLKKRLPEFSLLRPSDP